MIFAQPLAILNPRRTAIGKLGGTLADIEPHDLLARTFRATLDPLAEAARAEVADVLVGNVRNSIGNIARVAALEAGIPPHVPAATIDRQCASSMEALAIAAARLSTGEADAIVVGGVESASRAPWLYEKTPRAYAYAEPRPFRVRMSSEALGDPPMGETAELLADDFGITRESMDAFAVASHLKASAAHAMGAFDAERIAVEIPGRKGPTRIVEDECVRADTSLDALAKLRPAFRANGRVTAGNSSPLNDGAVACVLATEAFCERHGIEPTAWLAGAVRVGLDPKRMGLGPALAIPKLLDDAKLAVGDVDLYEVNEAFAAQVLAVLMALERAGHRLPPDRLNVHGGAIAIGHPLGATGLRLVTTLANAMRRRDAKTGIASLCIGGGQGMAVLVRAR